MTTAERLKAAERFLALERDAARYRWLRDTKRLSVGPVVGRRYDKEGCRYILSASSLGMAPVGAGTLDAAIDAAMKEKAK